MEKNIKDYLHLYLGCDVEFVYETRSEYPDLKHSKRIGTFIAINNRSIISEADIFCKSSNYRVRVDEIKPILRPLSDMIDEEKEKVYDFLFSENKQGVNWTGKIDFIEWLLDISNDYPSDFNLCEGLYLAITFKEFAAITNILRKHGFDLDGLIESGLAIDKTTLK